MIGRMQYNVLKTSDVKLKEQLHFKKEESTLNEHVKKAKLTYEKHLLESVKLQIKGLLVTNYIEVTKENMDFAMAIAEVEMKQEYLESGLAIRNGKYIVDKLKSYQVIKRYNYDI